MASHPLGCSSAAVAVAAAAAAAAAGGDGWSGLVGWTSPAAWFILGTNPGSAVGYCCWLTEEGGRGPDKWSACCCMAHASMAACKAATRHIQWCWGFPDCCLAGMTVGAGGPRAVDVRSPAVHLVQRSVHTKYESGYSSMYPVACLRMLHVQSPWADHSCASSASDAQAVRGAASILAQQTLLNATIHVPCEVDSRCGTDTNTPLAD